MNDPFDKFFHIQSNTNADDAGAGAGAGYGGKKKITTAKMSYSNSNTSSDQDGDDCYRNGNGNHHFDGDDCYRDYERSQKKNRYAKAERDYAHEAKTSAAIDALLKQDLKEIRQLKRELNLIELEQELKRLEKKCEKVNKAKAQARKHKSKNKNKRKHKKNSSSRHKRGRGGAGGKMDDTVKVLLKQTKKDSQGNTLTQCKGYERDDQGIFKVAEERYMNNGQRLYMQSREKDNNGQWINDEKMSGFDTGRGNQSLKSFHKKFDREFGYDQRMDFDHMKDVEHQYDDAY